MVVHILGAPPIEPDYGYDHNSHSQDDDPYDSDGDLDSNTHANAHKTMHSPRKIGSDDICCSC